MKICSPVNGRERSPLVPSERAPRSHHRSRHRYDIHQGEPAGKAIISGIGGAVVAAGTGAAIGTAIAGPVGTVVGAGAGIVFGLAASGALDWGYGQLPQGVKDSIENGVKEAGDAGEAVRDGAKKVWNAIYHALSFYHSHADRRAELGTNAALDRINHGTIRT